MSLITPSDAPRPQPRPSSSQTVLAVALALPGTLLVVATAAMLLVVPFGVELLWPVEEITLSEAAALRDNAEAVRLIGLGVNPNEPAAVRPGLVHSNALQLTPLEAATAARRADMIETLLEHGAVIDAAVWTRLWCIAEAVGSSEVREFLEERRPPEASDGCGGVRTPWSAQDP